MSASAPDHRSGPSAKLAAFASGLGFEDIPSAAVARLKLCLLDAIGCGVFATGLPWGQIISEYALAQGGEAKAIVWGRGRHVSAAMAALANGTLIHGFELDDLHKRSILHPSSSAVPAALALAETRGPLSGREFIAANVAGFEVGIRVGISVGTGHLVQGFHPTGTNGTVAAAAAAGRAIGLDPQMMMQAISIGATQAAGLMAAQFESMVKRMHAGRAAQAGVYGAELAESGFVGIDGVFEVDYGGYCSTLSPKPDLAALTAGLGDVFETENVGFKIYSCCGSCHTSVEAARRILAKSYLSPHAIERIEVEATRATLLHVGWPYEPRSITAAQMNLPYCIAITFMEGDAFVEQFTAERVRDPGVIDLARRVEVKQNPAFDALGPAGRHKIRALVYLRDGSTVEETVAAAKGSDSDPLTSVEVVDKYRRLVEPIAGRDWAAEMHDLIMSLDKAASTARLSELLSGPFVPSSSREKVQDHG
jgi:2-methylcitrate dehydratase PrpD